MARGTDLAESVFRQRTPVALRRARWTGGRMHWACWIVLALSLPGVRAEVFISDCDPESFEQRFREAIRTDGFVTLQCPLTNHVRSPVVIGSNQVVRIRDTTTTGWLAGSGSNQLFRVEAGGSLTLENVRLRGGRALGATGLAGTPDGDGGAGGDGLGGAVWVEAGGFLEAGGSRFLDHQAVGGNGGPGADIAGLGGRARRGGAGGWGLGGAIANVGGRVVLTDCRFDQNRAQGGEGGDGGSGVELARDGADGGGGGTAMGGAIYSTGGGVVELVRCQISDNSVSGGMGGEGGAGGGLLFFDGRHGQPGGSYGGGIALEGDETELSFQGGRLDENSAVGLEGRSGSLNAMDRAAAAGQAGLPGRGGAVYLTDARFEAREILFENNRAGGGDGGEGGRTSGMGDGGDGGDGGAGQGGALHATGNATLHLTDCEFVLNQATGGAGGFGAEGSTGVSFLGKDGAAAHGQGGAIHQRGGTMRVERSTFASNLAQGAVGLEGLGGNAWSPGLPGTPGGAGLGGGIFVADGVLEVTNSTFHANGVIGGVGGAGGNGAKAALFATDGGDGASGGQAKGGAVWIEMALEGVLVHCTFTGNTATGGSGGAGGAPGQEELAWPGRPGSAGAASGGAVGGTLARIVLLHSLLAGSSDGLEEPARISNVSGGVLDGGFNLSSDGSFEWTAPGSRGDVEFQQVFGLADNGGPTRTVALASHSPARDALPEDSLVRVGTDQRGQDRDATADIGAFEFAVTVPTPGIELLGAAVVVFWPDLGVDFTVQSSSSLAPADWVDAGVGTWVDGRWEYLAVSTGLQRYFRLRR
jgi:hypothetical protein